MIVDMTTRLENENESMNMKHINMTYAEYDEMNTIQGSRLTANTRDQRT